MTIETIETEPTTVLTEEPTADGAADADLEAGFSSGDIDAPTGEPSPASSDAALEDGRADDAAPALEPVYVQLTKADYDRLQTSAETVEKIAASLEQRFGTAFGHIGGLQQKLKEMQEATPRGHAVKLSDEDFAELRTEFPEMAEMQMKGLERVIARLGGTGSAGLDEPTASKLVEDKVSAVVTQFRRDTLTDLHEDWEEVVGPEGSATPYRQWLATQPKDYQDKINASQRPGVIAKSIDKFRGFEAARVRKPGAPSNKPSQFEAERRQELAEAVTPRGSGGKKTGRTAEDDLMAGFNGE
jgi:uncharacterized protein YheU (UPF0270 family)